MNDELRQLAKQAEYEALEIGVSKELRDEIQEAWKRFDEEKSMAVNRLHRGTKE